MLGRWKKFIVDFFMCLQSCPPKNTNTIDDSSALNVQFNTLLLPSLKGDHPTSQHLYRDELSVDKLQILVPVK